MGELGSDLSESAESSALSGHARALGEKIAARTARVAVLGLGYVGLPLLLAFHRGGFPVLGFDVDAGKLDQLAAGRSYFKHIPDDQIAALQSSGRFEGSNREADLARADVLIICVPTPLTPEREPDLSYVTDTVRSVTAHLRPGQLIVLESTTYPGTTAEVVAPLLAESGLALDHDLFLAYSPEREDPGNTTFTTQNIPKVVGADSAIALDLANNLYSQVIPVTVPVSSAATAEAVKLTENIFRAVNIALVNELKVVYAAMGLDVWEVIEAAKTKPFGYMPFYPGPGLGGHCIPIDPFYLTWRARQDGIATRFIELAGEINTGMPTYAISQLRTALDTRFGTSLSQAKILLIGMAYKKNVDDTRESPALEIMSQLLQRGAEAHYHDPHVPRIPRTRKHPQLEGRQSAALTPALLRACDAVLICTDHDDVDYQMIAQEAPLVVDTRNCVPKGTNVVTA